MVVISDRDSRRGGLATGLLVSGLLLLAACAGDDPLPASASHNANHEDGASGEVADVDFVVDIEMSEFAFDIIPSEFEAGSTVLFVFTNNGGMEHEAIIGDMDAQRQAEATMANGAGHDETGHSSDAPSIVLQPGESGELVVVFDESAEVIVGCHIPGHWDLGMHTELTLA